MMALLASRCCHGRQPAGDVTNGGRTSRRGTGRRETLASARSMNVAINPVHSQQASRCGRRPAQPDGGREASWRGPAHPTRAARPDRDRRRGGARAHRSHRRVGVGRQTARGQGAHEAFHKRDLCGAHDRPARRSVESRRPGCAGDPRSRARSASCPGSWSPSTSPRPPGPAPGMARSRRRRHARSPAERRWRGGDIEKGPRSATANSSRVMRMLRQRPSADLGGHGQRAGRRRRSSSARCARSAGNARRNRTPTRNRRAGAERAFAVPRRVEREAQAPGRDAVEDRRSDAVGMRPHVTRAARVPYDPPQRFSAGSRARRGCRRGPPSPAHLRSVSGRRRARTGTPGWRLLALEPCQKRPADRPRTGASVTRQCRADRRGRCPDDAGSRRKPSRSRAQTTRRPGRVRPRAARADRARAHVRAPARPRYGGKCGGRVTSSAVFRHFERLVHLISSAKPIDPARRPASRRGSTGICPRA